MRSLVSVWRGGARREKSDQSRGAGPQHNGTRGAAAMASEVVLSDDAICSGRCRGGGVSTQRVPAPGCGALQGTGATVTDQRENVKRGNRPRYIKRPRRVPKMPPVPKMPRTDIPLLHQRASRPTADSAAPSPPSLPCRGAGLRRPHKNGLCAPLLRELRVPCGVRSLHIWTHLDSAFESKGAPSPRTGHWCC